MKKTVLSFLAIFFLGFLFLAGCKKKDHGLSSLNADEIKDIKTEIVNLNTKMDRILHSMEEMKDSFRINERMIQDLKMLFEKLEEGRAESTELYQRLIEEISKYSEMAQTELEEYESFIERMEDKMDQYDQNHQQNIAEYIDVLREIKKFLEERSSSYSSSSDQAQESNYYEDEEAVISDGNIKGTVRKGKISGLKGGYQTY